MAIVNVNKLNKIRDYYPNTWEWMRHKASWEHISVGAVLCGYEDYIDELINQENIEKNPNTNFKRMKYVRKMQRRDAPIKRDNENR